MKRRTTIAASMAVLAVTLLGIPRSAGAQTYGTWCSDGFTSYNDPTGRSVQSPWTCIYPAANWSYFFHRARHYGPIVVRQNPSDPRYRWWYRWYAY